MGAKCRRNQVVGIFPSKSNRVRKLILQVVTYHLKASQKAAQLNDGKKTNGSYNVVPPVIVVTNSASDVYSFEDDSFKVSNVVSSGSLFIDGDFLLEDLVSF